MNKPKTGWTPANRFGVKVVVMLSRKRRSKGRKAQARV